MNEHDGGMRSTQVSHCNGSILGAMNITLWFFKYFSLENCLSVCLLELKLGGKYTTSSYDILLGYLSS